MPPRQRRVRDYLLRFVSRNINHYQERIENLLERSE
jgi:hypothetical protein